ncbi:MAG: NAD-dependent epimerase/dehydratase family protein [Candidatus Eremiobacteraeota bacterium]|nr:NAD-dependent epimerase/dehydratase family protein [Candidatus Eremiobacteraeota bacterium]
MAQKTVFVTGASGFVGGHLARALVERGDRVRALRRGSSDTRLVDDLPIQWIEGDLLRPSSYLAHLKGCDTVFHCAADYRLFSKDPTPMYEINVTGSKALLSACLEMEIPKVVYTSSVAALDLPAPGQVSDESCRAEVGRIVGHYKKSKFLAQEAVLELAQAGLPVVLVNPSTPIGPGDLKPTATGKIIVDFLNRKMPAYLDTGLNLVPVEDVAQGHLLAEEKGVDGELYILGHLNLTLKEILEMLAAVTGLSAPRVKIPYRVAWAVGVLDTLVEGHVLNRTPQVPLEGVKMARKKMFFDPQKARDELGFRPGSVRDALRRAVDWFVANGYAPEPAAVGR